jgi:hypothetical protein
MKIEASRHFLFCADCRTPGHQAQVDDEYNRTQFASADMGVDVAVICSIADGIDAMRENAAPSNPGSYY